MSTTTTETTEATLNPATVHPPQTAAGAARSLALYVTGEPRLADSTVRGYTRILRKATDSGAYSESDWNAALGIAEANPLGALVLRVLEDRASENDVVLDSSKCLEAVLKDKYGAEGRGLHEYTTDVEPQIPEKLAKTLRWLATVRNNVVHGDGDGLGGIPERARYALQAARAWDGLVKAGDVTGEFAVSGNGGVLNSNRRISLKVKMVNPKVFLVAWLVLFACPVLMIYTWDSVMGVGTTGTAAFYAMQHDHWSDHPNLADDFWLEVVVFVGTLVTVVMLPKKEHEFPLLEINKPASRPPRKGSDAA